MAYVIVRTNRSNGRRAWLQWKRGKRLGVGARRLGWGPKDCAELFETAEAAKHALPWELHRDGIISVEEVDD